MTRISRALQRALVLLAATAAAVALGLFAAITPASAHVHVEADKSVLGQWALLTFEVPNESENGSLTTQLAVTMPAGVSASAETVPGWTVTVDRDVAGGTVRSVTWSASPGVGIPQDQFALFRLSLKLPQTDQVNFPATQTYSDGTAVKWDDEPRPDGGEPDHPAPTLTLAAEASPSHADDTARWLAIAALVVGAAAAGLTLIRTRS